MAELSSLEITVAIGVVATALSAFPAFCPPMSDVLHHTDDKTRRAVEFGQNAGAIATLATGAVLSWVSRSPMPLVIALGISAAIAYAYEFAFQRSN